MDDGDNAHIDDDDIESLYKVSMKLNSRRDYKMGKDEDSKSPKKNQKSEKDDD